MTTDPHDSHHPQTSPLAQANLAEAFRDRDLASVLVRLNRATGFEAISRGIVHDLRNPLQTITMAAGVIADSGSSGADPGPLGMITLKAAQQMEEILQRISRPPPGIEAEVRPLVVSEVVQDVTRMQRSNPSKGDPSIEVRVPQDLPAVLADEENLRHALFSLVQNAREAVLDSHGTMVTLTAEQDGEYVDLNVEDDGPGIQEDLWENALRPFFTTRSEDSHLGLGLPVAAHLAEGWGGFLRLDHDKPGAGARLVLRLRAARGSAIPRR